jgi:hypothetical protein
MMKGSIITLVPTLIGISILGSSGSALAQISVNVSTGLNASNHLITTGGVNDAHWTVDTGFSNPTGIPQTVYPNNADWFGGWIANGPDSDWIARNANVTSNGAAPYSFYRTFDLTGADLTTASLTGAWTIDDEGTLSLNGHVISTLSAGSWSALTPFVVTTGSPLFNSGLNRLTITITASDQFLEGVRLQGSVTANVSSTPEPGTYALFASLGLTGVTLLRRRRSR